MTMADRASIESGLMNNCTFKQIAKNIGKDQTTISKEIKRNIFVLREANRHGEDVCPLLLKAPYVCNGCKKRSYCRLEIRMYNAKRAQKSYEEKLIDSRTGVMLNRKEFYEDDKVIDNGIRNGQHIYHIAATNDLHMSVSTIYRNFQKGYLSSSKLSLPRAVKFRPRRKTRDIPYVPSAVKRGRTWSDFNDYIEQNDISSWVEMDTVIGNPGGKVIATFLFTEFNFMFGILLDNKTSAEMTRKITTFKKRFADFGYSFGELFPLILTDNGGEFANVNAFIKDLNGNVESELFFCDPYKSCQKPNVEKNHTIFRDICPKGTSFDNFNQEIVNAIFSHVNCTKRKKLSKKSPFELFEFAYGKEITSLLGITNIPDNEVCQSPSLLEKLGVM